MNRKQTEKDRPLAGSVEGIAAGTVFGWIAGAPTARKPSVEIYLGNQFAGSASATTWRQDVVDQGLAEGAWAFAFDFSSHLKDKQNHAQTIRLVQPASGQALAGSPVSVTADLCHGHFETLSGIELHGWAAFALPNGRAVSVGLWIDGTYVTEMLADLPRPDLAAWGDGLAHCGFIFTLPARCLDGSIHKLMVRYMTSGVILPNGEQNFTMTLRHAITQADHGGIAGWMFIEETPQACLPLEVFEDGRLLGRIQTNHCEPPVPVLLRQQHGVAAVGFRFALPPAAKSGAPRRIRLTLAGQLESVTGRDILIAPVAHLIERLQHAAHQDDALRWWAAGWIDQLRQECMHGTSLCKEIPASTAAMDPVVDIIIPVYKGHAETLACLADLLACVDESPREIIVINDASPDAALTADLRVLAGAEQRLTLLENSVNLGFVATVNRGIALHPERDVILLNADTLVPLGDWVRRLRAAAYAEPAIATATPFSNRATLCSLPIPNVDNDLPEGLDVTAMDDLCAQINRGLRVDIPTAVGFCMYIRRAALDEIGPFDAQRWGKGYGEENDFCLKASTIGWRHVAACDVFIQHHGSVSFQGEKAALVMQNLQRLNAIYPDYPDRIRRVLRDDPLSVPRAQVVLRLMQEAARKHQIGSHVLHITHAWGGGVQLHVDRLCRLSGARRAKNAALRTGGLILRPTTDERVEIFQPYSGLALGFPLAAITDAACPLATYLRALGVNAIHMHQWIGLPPEIWDLAASLDLPFDYTVHDYYSFCPRIHMIDHTGRYCGQAPLSRCTQCITAKALEPAVEPAFVALGNDIAAWRNFHQTQLARARHVFAPCRDAAQRMEYAFGHRRIAVRPHEPAPRHFAPKPMPKAGEEVHIAVIGAIGQNKGYDLLLALVQLAEVQAHHLRFVIIGHTQDDTPFAALDNVRITGRYTPHELPDLLASLDCTVALFLSPWPETWSYTLSEAWAAGLTPLVPALGALGERVTDSGYGGTFSENPTPLQIVADLLTLTELSRQRRTPSSSRTVRGIYGRIT